jgi:hypothetical protein
MRNYWHVWYDLSYDSIRPTIRHIIFSVHKICNNEWYKKAYLHQQLHGEWQDLLDRGYLNQI